MATPEGRENSKGALPGASILTRGIGQVREERTSEEGWLAPALATAGQAALPDLFYFMRTGPLERTDWYTASAMRTDIRPSSAVTRGGELFAIESINALSSCT